MIPVPVLEMQRISGWLDIDIQPILMIRNPAWDRIWQAGYSLIARPDIRPNLQLGLNNQVRNFLFLEKQLRN